MLQNKPWMELFLEEQFIINLEPQTYPQQEACNFTATHWNPQVIIYRSLQNISVHKSEPHHFLDASILNIIPNSSEVARICSESSVLESCYLPIFAFVGKSLNISAYHSDNKK